MGPFVGQSGGKLSFQRFTRNSLNQSHQFNHVAQTMQEDLTGAAFHPLDDNLLITHGRGHLTFWNRRKDGFFERTDIIKPVSLIINVTFSFFFFSIHMELSHRFSCLFLPLSLSLSLSLSVCLSIYLSLSLSLPLRLSRPART